MRKILMGLISIYQGTISPYLGEHCRFYPSCSEWTKEAVKSYGPVRGMVLGIKRILSCHPFSPGGYRPLKQVHG
ncbi:MAG: membrane protein insertion efficiency factor YidD [Candidatus Omnitrophica bacterium]|nr:membrane protein insertion efficiency factor YidD [Candidatus Omnitrophota bacterium]